MHGRGHQAARLIETEAIEPAIVLEQVEGRTARDRIMASPRWFAATARV
jgi:hypothetical protein